MFIILLVIIERNSPLSYPRWEAVKFNHFCEVEYAEGTEEIFVTIHSGSRNMGSKVADYFDDLAKELNKKWHSENSGIGFLPADSPQGQAYLGWMNFCLEFAYLNRKAMLDEVKKTFLHEFPNVKWTTKEIADDVRDDILNIHHNWAVLETCMGKTGYVHRKGSTRAFKGMTGIIPGSMSSATYIVAGKANLLSLQSCSHGSGRRMGRMAFNRKMKYSYAQIEKSLEGIVHSEFKKVDRGKDKDLLDVSECGDAYKNVEEVMANQVDLVDPIIKLRPLICLKG